MRRTDNDDEPPHKNVQNEENERTTSVTWTSVHKPQLNRRRKERENKEQLESLGIKCEGDGGQDVAHLEEIKSNNRREVLCDGSSWRRTQSSSCGTQ